jgi:Protein of unknown function (DUF3558)
VRIRRALVPLVLVAGTALTACGGADDDSGSKGDASDATPTSGVASDPTESDVPDLDVEACDLLSADEVAEAVGTPVKEGTPSSGPAITGGEFSSCTWVSDDPDHPADSATITVYPNSDAADSARGEDAQPVEELGSSAFSAAFASIWVYVDERSLFAQWYTFNGTDAENLPLTKALAEAAVDAL